jgi:Zn finger protein HypA/HybF involved in hydrogenase expression
MSPKKPDQHASPDPREAICPVCGARNPESCNVLEKLGTRSLEADHREICPVCGSDYALVVWARGFKMCELCFENIDQALRILRHKHKKRLERILLELDR